MQLPEEEVLLLRSLYNSKGRRNYRAKQLFDAGFTLQSIGDAFEPPYRRSTVKYWVETSSPAHKLPNPVPTPHNPHPKTEKYVRKTPPSPGIPPTLQQRLAHLSPLARQYRSGMTSTSLYASANEEFNEIIHALYENDVKIAEIARSAGVTNRAIARRLGK